MPAFTTEIQGQSSTAHLPPQAIRTQSMDPTESSNNTQTPLWVDPGTFDDTVVPPSHDTRTIVLCFDGTGDQFNGDVCAHSYSYERRAKFKATSYYHLPRPDDQKGTRPGEMPLSNQCHWRPHYHNRHHKKGSSDDKYDDGPTTTDVLEVWFAGCHSDNSFCLDVISLVQHLLVDVGGGSVPNGTRDSLARIPLHWMIRQCFLVNTGIQFDRELFEDTGLDPTTLFPFVTSRPTALNSSASTVARVRASAYRPEANDVTLGDQVCTFGSEENEERSDALSPMYDQLKLSPAWWILEILPLCHHVQDRKECSWKHFWQYVSFSSFFIPALSHPCGCD